MVAPATPNKSQATTTKVTKQDDVLVVASEKGFDSSAGVTVREGEEFYVTREQAVIGASWFEAKDEGQRKELEAERKKREEKTGKEARAARIAAAVDKAETDTGSSLA